MRVEGHGQRAQPNRQPLSPDDVVVRGGDMESSKLQRNAEEHFHAPSTRGEWALSVASLPGATADEIVAAAPQIRQRCYRTATAGQLTTAGYDVVADDPPHALVLLPSEPTEDVCLQLRELFADEFPNPLFYERKQRGRGQQ